MRFSLLLRPRVPLSDQQKRRRATSALSIVGAAALVGGLLSAPLSAVASPLSATPSVVATQAVPSTTVPQLSKKEFAAAVKAYKPGKYIVTLKDAPAATYGGGVAGLAPTKVAKGKQLDAKATGVRKYSSYLAGRQHSVAKAVGVTPLASYSIAYNGFGAKLTAVQAARLAKSPAVASVVPAVNLKVQSEPKLSDENSSLNYLKVAGDSGTWDQIGGHDNAGKGVVVGDIDTGIAPENPSFAGSTLGSTVSSTTPYLSGSAVKFVKSDGATFSSSIVPDGKAADGDTYSSADEWSKADLSTKIIAAHYYDAGFGADNIGGHAVGEYASPRDGGGHGSHTASTAAGDYGVDASVQGVDFGQISGVAPAAKLAIYKVCWTGPDGVEDSDDDGCNTIDMLSAINQAVADGVDVLNFSIGGAAAETTYSPTDAAFFNAASAGVFVSAAAGNAGPGASTADNAAPWETTVAASTIPDYEATVVLGNGAKYAGSGISVQSDIASTALVLGADHPATGQTATDANLCIANSLSSDVAGKIVVCDRGTNDRVAKSAEVKRAGGVGLVLVNVPGGADDTDNDFHSVPTVHLAAADHDAIHSYAHSSGAKASLVKGNSTGKTTPVPQVAGFSSRGPVQAAGSDILKPDVAAPGVSILAAVANPEEGDPKWDFYSGTSMATPHVTGLAALYLGQHPTATPSEIKSALMTTGSDLKSSTGTDVTDPFTQGAGEVVPTDYLDPGLVYLSGPSDWKAYIKGAGQYVDYAPYVSSLDLSKVTAIDPSDLNEPSISIGDLTATQTVKRTVTAKTSGDYTASISGLKGLKATVSPSSFHIEEGKSATFTVTFSATSSTAQDAWATGFLTWTPTSGSAVRSPIAVHPTSVTANASASGSGVTGHTAVSFTPHFTGKESLHLQGLARGEANHDIANDSGDEAFGAFLHEVAAGSTSAEFDVAPNHTAAGDDLDLEVYYTTDPETLAGLTLVGQSATSSASERVTLTDPAAGYYVTKVDYYDTQGDDLPYTEVAYDFSPHTVYGALKASPSPVPVSAGKNANVTLSWSHLPSSSQFLGFVSYGASGASTRVTVSTPKLTEHTAAHVTGKVSVGHTVKAVTGSFAAGTLTIPSSWLSYSYQWLKDGKAISKATKASYTIPASVLGHKLAVRVTAHYYGSTANSRAKSSTVQASTHTSVKLAHASISTKAKGKVTVTVTELGTKAHPTGKITLHYGSHKTTVSLTSAKKGKVSVTLPKLKTGSYKVWAKYVSGHPYLHSSSSAKKTLKVHRVR